MSFLPVVGGLFGGAASGNTSGYTPSQANIVNPLTNAGVEQGINSQQQLATALAGNNGAANQGQVYQQQQALAQQLQGLANGQGANPAQAALAQNTATNVANQAALMAGQRGAGSNVGLIARQAAQQGANTQQQSVGQAATLQAQQQLAFTQALQQQQAALGTTAQNQVANQAGVTQNLTQDQINAIQGYNNAQVGSQSSVNSANANLYGSAAGAQSGIIGGALKGTGSVLASVLAKGGVAGEDGQVILKEGYKGKSKIGHILYSGPQLDMKSGGKVPGKPEVGGAVDSYKNDKIDAKLSPGEIVIPRSVTKSANPSEGAKKFVEALLAKKGKK